MLQTLRWSILFSNSNARLFVLSNDCCFHHIPTKIPQQYSQPDRFRCFDAERNILGLSLIERH